MDKQLQVALAVIAGALVACIGASVGVFLVGRQFVVPTSTTDPEQAARIGHQIVDYALPPGYREMQASNAWGYKMVMISAGKNVTYGMMITLVEFPTWTGMGREGWPGQIETADEIEDDLDLGTVTTRTMTIRGRPVTFYVSESAGSGVPDYRQAWCSFPGRGGSTVMVMVGGTKDDWDQSALDHFLASIR